MLPKECPRRGRLQNKGLFASCDVNRFNSDASLARNSPMSKGLMLFLHRYCPDRVLVISD